jgi:hypothetical protein
MVLVQLSASAMASGRLNEQRVKCFVSMAVKRSHTIKLANNKLRMDISFVNKQNSISVDEAAA